MIGRALRAPAGHLRGSVERASERVRSRNADATFLVGRRFLSDRILSDLYFTLRVDDWQRRSEDGDHMASFERGLNLCPDPSNVLDLCTGTAHSAASAARQFPAAQVVAVDNSRRMIRRAEGLHGLSNLDLRCADVVKLPFPDGRFDLITCLNGVCWPREVERVAAPGAHLLLAKSFVQPQEVSRTWLAIWHDNGFERKQWEAIGTGGFELFERVSGSAGVG